MPALTKETRNNISGNTVGDGDGAFFKSFNTPSAMLSTGGLMMNERDDLHEGSATEVTGTIMRAANKEGQNKFFKPAVSFVQRKCAGCEKEEKRMQRKEAEGQSKFPHINYGGIIQRQQPPAGGSTAAAGPPPCQTPSSAVVTSEGSDLLSISEVTKPCYACPNSSSVVCPKLAQKIFPPVATNPVQFSWQVKFVVLNPEKGSSGEGKFKYVVQKIESTFNFSQAPAQGYSYTPVYWEAFALDNNDQTEIDYWQFDIPDNTAGTWEKKGTLYCIKQLPSGMAVGNVPESAGAMATTKEPKGLGPVRGYRKINGRFNFTGSNKIHSFQ